jgi:hypothetical protein
VGVEIAAFSFTRRERMLLKSIRFDPSGMIKPEVFETIPLVARSAETSILNWEISPVLPAGLDTAYAYVYFPVLRSKVTSATIFALLNTGTGIDPTA